MHSALSQSIGAFERCDTGETFTSPDGKETSRAVLEDAGAASAA